MRFQSFIPMALLVFSTGCVPLDELFRPPDHPPIIEELTFAEPLSLNDGCEGTIYEGQLGSSTLAQSSDNQRIYAVNRDAGTLTVVDQATGAREEIDLGLEPTRLVRNGDHVYVSLRGERAILVLKETGESLTIMDEIQTGAEPFGLVASPDGTRVYAAISMENEVLEINTATHEVAAAWAIPNEPRWLAIHPSGNALFVASATGSVMHMITLGETPEITPLNLPNAANDAIFKEIFAMSMEEAQEEFGGAEGDAMISMLGFGMPTTGRVTGDPTISPDGRSLFIPILYVDNHSPFPKGMDMSDFNSLEDHGDVDFFGDSNAYAQSNRLMPGIGEIPLIEDEEGNVLTDNRGNRFYRQDQALTDEEHQTNSGLNTIKGGLSFFDVEEASVTSSMTMDFVPPVLVTSFPTSVRVSSDCRFVTATIEGMNVVSVMRRADICQEAGNNFDRCGNMAFDAEDLPDDAPSSTLHTPPMTVVDTPAGPGGLLLLNGQLYVHAQLDRRLTRVELEPIRTNLTREKQCPENNWEGVEPYQEVAVDPFQSVDFPMCSYDRFETESPVLLTDFTLPEAIEEGRRLFLSARDTRMSGLGSSISCSTCHPGGRTDGNTWQFDDHPRQTPTLAGNISQTEPVSWFNEVPTVRDEVMLTSQGRMGGTGLTDEEALNVATYIDWVRPVDNSRSDILSQEAELGRAIFEDQEVGCSKCHAGPQLTDNSIHEVNGVPVRTPKLRGVRATAPFLHDGSAPTLRDVVEVSNSINMGNLKWLTDEELDYLVDYLESL